MDGTWQKAFDRCHASGWQAKVTTITAKERICFMDEVKCDPKFCPYAAGYFDRINEATKDLFESEQLFNRSRIETYAKNIKFVHLSFHLPWRQLVMRLLVTIIICLILALFKTFL